MKNKAQQNHDLYVDLTYCICGKSGYSKRQGMQTKQFTDYDVMLRCIKKTNTRVHCQLTYTEFSICPQFCLLLICIFAVFFP